MKRTTESKTTPAATDGEKPKKSRRRKVAELLGAESCPTPAEAIELLEFRVFLRDIGVEALNALAAESAEYNEAQLGKKAAQILETWGSMSEKRRAGFLDALVEKARLVAESDVGPVPEPKKKSSVAKKRKNNSAG